MTLGFVDPRFCGGFTSVFAIDHDRAAVDSYSLNFGDHAIYPDCRESFVKNMSAAISAGTYAGITIDAPYTNISKTDIARKGKSLGIDYSETWSCYKGGKIHCGKCGTCLERKEALAEAGINDTTEYEA